jgi:hypothetical protein
MATHPALADLGIAPRLLTREQAAAYCGLSVHGFSEWVKAGRLPGPIHGTIRWTGRQSTLPSMSSVESMPSLRVRH